MIPTQRSGRAKGHFFFEKRKQSPRFCGLLEPKSQQEHQYHAPLPLFSLLCLLLCNDQDHRAYY